MPRLALSLFAMVVLGCFRGSVVRADGGQVRLSQARGDLQITVFTSPSPLRAGPVDVSVSIQNAATSRPVLDLPVFVEVTPRNRSQPAIRTEATTAAATNKLFRAAEFEIDSAGWWDVRVECVPPSIGDPIVLEFAMEAGPPLPAWLTVWPWYGWPVLVVLLYVVHRYLVWRRSGRRCQSTC